MLFHKVTTVSTYGDRYPQGVTLFECSDCGALVTVDGQGKHSAFHLSLLGNRTCECIDCVRADLTDAAAGPDQSHPDLNSDPR